MGIDPPLDSSENSIVDSIEVYAIERNLIEEWLPTGYISQKKASLDNGQTMEKQENEHEHESDEGSEALFLGCQSLLQLSELWADMTKEIGSKTDRDFLSGSDGDFLRQLIQDTAFAPHKALNGIVRSLFTSLVPDARARNSFYDESVLFGWMNALAQAKLFVDQSDSLDKTTWDGIRSLLNECLQIVSKISRERPMNYLQSMEKVSEAHWKSVAVCASRLAMIGAKMSWPCSDILGNPGGVVDLCLNW